MSAGKIGKSIARYVRWMFGMDEPRQRTRDLHQDEPIIRYDFAKMKHPWCVCKHCGARMPRTVGR